MTIKNHQLYELYLLYLESKNLKKGVKAIAEISESMFYEFIKKYEFNPGFKEKWNNKLLENKRDENIQSILDRDPYNTFFETLDENVFIQYDREKNLEKVLNEDFEMFFDSENVKTNKELDNLDDDIFDF